MKLELNKIVGLILMVVLMSQNAHAQPPNDFCSGAFAITADGTCYGPGLAETTTAASEDNWIGTVACAGNNPEVWFTFVATGTDLNISVTGGTMGGNIEFILVEATGPCSGLTLEGSACGASPLNTLVSNSLTVGATYYYTVSSTGTDGTFTTCVTNTTPPPVPGQDCPSAAPLCDNSSFSQGVFTGVGVAETISTNSCFGGNERQAKWYTFTAGVSGTFGFDILPTVGTNDYDFALWNTTAGCYTSGTTMGTPLACNWSGVTGPTGINQWGNLGTTTPNPCSVFGAADCTNGGGPNSGCQPCTYDDQISLVAGETYTILIDNFSASGTGFNTSFGGTAVMGQPADFIASIDPTCLIATLDRTIFYTGPNSTYLWNYGDGNTSTSGNPGTYTYSTTGVFTISLTVTDAVGCVKTFSQTLNVGCILLPVELSAFTAESINNEVVELSWETVTEDDNDFFTIERSEDSDSFDIVAIVKGAGTSQEAKDYVFIDRSPFSGISYYRLKQTDFDGKWSYSDIVSVSLQSSFGDVAVLPNPVKGNSILSFGSAKAVSVIVSIKDITGKTILEKNHISSPGKNTVNLDTENFNHGMYFLILNNGTELNTIKFIVE